MTVNDLTVAIFISLSVPLTSAQEVGQVGPKTNGTYLVPTMQLIKPAGDTLTFSGRAIDLALSPDGKSVFVKYDQGVLVIDPETWQIREQVGIGEGSSIHGIAVRRDGTRVYVTGNNNTLWDGNVSSSRLANVHPQSHPARLGRARLFQPLRGRFVARREDRVCLPLAQEQFGPRGSGIRQTHPRDCRGRRPV